MSMNEKDNHGRRMFIACIFSCILSFFMWFCNKVFVCVLFFIKDSNRFDSIDKQLL